MTFGSGKYTYRPVEGWGKGPDGRKLGIVSSMATDSQDRVYVIDREPNPAIVVFDREGRFLTSWGEDFFNVPHAIWIGPDDIVYITDCGMHTVTTHTLEGELLSTFGTPNRIGEPGKPFNKPTWAVCGNYDDIYVTDGYGQNRVHRFAKDGAWICSWGSGGQEPGQFNIPHGVRVDKNDRALILDRENSRIQIFDAEGSFLAQWTHLLAANDLFIDGNDILYLAQALRRISILTLDGEVIAEWGEEGEAPGQFVDYPHGIWVDSRGDIYVCEVPFTPHRIQKYALQRAGL